MRHVYLAGPILGCTINGAKDWRQYASDKLKEAGVVGISPLRCEPLVGEKYGVNHADPRFGTSRAIAHKNLFDVRTCDLTLAYMPLPEDLGLKHQSYGTICEVAWAKALGNPAIVVTNDPEIQNHPVVNACAGWMLNDIDDAIDVCIGILGGYVTGGKNV